MIFDNTKKIMSYIRYLMIEEDVSMNEVANRLNKSQPTISSLFKSNNIKYDSLKEVCDALGYDIDITLIKKEAEE